MSGAQDHDKDPDNDLRSLLEASDRRTSARHDAAVLSAARAFAEEPQHTRAPQAMRTDSSFAPRWALAAGIAALAIAATLGWRVVEQGRELAAIGAERDALGVVVADLEKQVTRLERQTEELTATLQSERANASRSAPSGSALAVARRVLASLALSPGLVRGEEARAAVSAPREDGDIRLVLDLSTAPTHEAYRVVLATEGGKEVWKSGALTPAVERARRTLSVDVPARTLAIGAYELALRSDGSSEDLTYYYFDVTRR